MPSLEMVAVTFEDVDALLPNQYRATYLEVDPVLGGIEAEEIYTRMFLTGGAYGTLLMELYRFSNRATANRAVSAGNITYEPDGDPVGMPARLSVPPNAWARDIGSHIVYCYSSGPVMVLSFLTLAGIDDDESVEAAAAFLGLVGQIQERRLIDAGYE